MAEEKQVTVYGTPGCPYCKMAKEYLTGRGVKFQYIDVAADHDAAKRMIELSGQMGVPQIVIGGTVIVGFDRGEVEKALEVV
jgi:glutaredoxin-like YruB-family protein